MVRDVVWLRGNAHEKFALGHSRESHPPDFSHGASAPFVSGKWGTDVHGTVSPQRKQKIDSAFLAAYLVIVATAAIVVWTHPKPELIPLLLWFAGHPL